MANPRKELERLAMRTRQTPQGVERTIYRGREIVTWRNEELAAEAVARRAFLRWRESRSTPCGTNIVRVL